MVFGPCISLILLQELRNFLKYSPGGQVLNMFKNFLFDKQLVLYYETRISLEATFTQVPNRNPIKPVLFLERKLTAVTRVQFIFVPVLVLFTRVHNHIGSEHFPPEQPIEISFAYKIQQTPPSSLVRRCLLNFVTVNNQDNKHHQRMRVL